MSYKSDLKELSNSKESREGKNYDFSDGKSSILEGKESIDSNQPIVNIEILSVDIKPSGMVDISSPIHLSIRFHLDHDVNNSYWIIKFLVDSCDKRIIRILGETIHQDYTIGQSEMFFQVDRIDISGISSSVLANYGLLIAELIIDNEAVAAVNMVINVKKEGDKILREILSPLD